jgi:hypothetical protein
MPGRKTKMFRLTHSTDKPRAEAAQLPANNRSNVPINPFEIAETDADVERGVSTIVAKDPKLTLRAVFKSPVGYKLWMLMILAYTIGCVVNLAVFLGTKEVMRRQQ